jgi:hypothetical protein
MLKVEGGEGKREGKEEAIRSLTKKCKGDANL